MDYQMLVLDIDGTLTTSKKEISPATKEALLAIQEEGYYVVLASGRPTGGMIRYAKELQLKKYGNYLLTVQELSTVKHKKLSMKKHFLKM